MKTTPILLQSSVSLLPGAFAQFTAQDLQHPFNQHMLIRSIQFSLFWGDSKNTSTNLNIGNSIRFQLRLGRLGLTGGRVYVPAWSFGKRISSLLEAITVQQGGVYYKRNTFTWVLPRPLLVPAYSALIAVATRQGSDCVSVVNAATAITTRIAYSGVSLPKGFRLPETFDVPYVSAFCDTDTGSTGHSDELDLKNTFEHPLKVQHLIGRVENTDGMGDTTDYFDTAPTVQVLTSRGEYVVNPHAQFNEVFEVMDRHMPVRSILEPGENFAIDLNGKLANQFPTVSMIGHHTMQTRDI